MYNDDAIAVLRTNTGTLLDSSLELFWTQLAQAETSNADIRPFIVCLAETDRFVWPALRVGESVEVAVRPDQVCFSTVIS